MTVTIRIPTLRSLALVLLGAALGATLIAPVSARVTGSAVEPTAIQTRSVSCAGLNWYPTDSDTPYSNNGTLRIRSALVGTGIFRCDPALPHRAVVQKVRFTLADYSPSALVDNCALRRSGLTVATASAHQNLATVPTTFLIDTPGTVRFTDTSIANGTVDNTKFAYWLECWIDSQGETNVGIYGADVTYTISSANG